MSHAPKPVKHRRLRGHVDAYRCCVKSLIVSALVGFDVRQHAQRNQFQACLIDRSNISPSLESTTCERLRIDYHCAGASRVASRTRLDSAGSTGSTLVSSVRIMSDLSMSRDHSYEGSRCQVPAVSEIDMHTSIVAAEAGPRKSRARAGGATCSDHTRALASVSERSIDHRVSSWRLPVRVAVTLRPRPTPIRASLSGLITT